MSMMQLPMPDMESNRSNSQFAGKSPGNSNSAKGVNSTTFNNKIKAVQRKEKELNQMGSFARAALPNMSRDNSERRGALPSFMSRGNSRQAGVATPKQQSMMHKGKMQDDLFFQE